MPFFDQGPNRDYSIQALRQGDDYVASHRAAGVADTNTAFTAVMQNPTGSGVEVLLRIQLRPGGLAQLNISTDIAIDTAGTAVTAINLNQEDGSAEAITAEVDGSYTINGDTVNSVVPGGLAGEGGGSSLPSSVVWKLGPGDSILYEVINRAGSGTDFGFVARWTEQNV